MKTRAAIASLILLTACAVTDPAASPQGSTPASTAATLPELPIPDDCVNPPVDITTLIEQDQRAACYGSADLTVEAQASVLMGAIDCPGDLRPSWMACGGTIVELYPLDQAATRPQIVLAARSPHSGPMISAVVHPDSGIDLSRGLDAAVTVTGHYDDPAAATCQYVRWVDDHPPAPEEVVAMCREVFAITHLELLDVAEHDMPATAAPPADITFAPHDIAQVATTGLVVRSAPGVGGDSEIFDWMLDAPTLLYVFDGPVSADGYEWYQVMPSRVDYLPSPYGVGWVAAAGKDGEPWIRPATPTCPRPTTDGLAALSGLGALACFSDLLLEVEGTLGGCMARDPAVFPAEPWQTRCWLAPFDCCPQVIPYPTGLPTWFETGGSLPFEGQQSSRLIGHFDDPSAGNCPDTAPDGAAPVPEGWGRFVCRTGFVVTDVVPLEDAGG